MYKQYIPRYHAVIYLGCITIRKPIKENHDFAEVIKKINTRLQFLYSLGEIDFCLNHFVDFSVMQKYNLILTMLGLMAFYYSNSHNSKV